MIDFSAVKGLATLDLGDFSAKPTSIEGAQMEAAVSLFTSPDGRVDIGVWECTPGLFSADRSASSEFCHFIFGKVEMTRQNGSKVLLGAGDSITLPLGWKGQWRVIEQVRKVYVITASADM